MNHYYMMELCESYKNRGPDSKFAHSEVFKVLSEEGATEARRICLELKKYAVQDQRSCKLRSDFLEVVVPKVRKLSVRRVWLVFKMKII